jgi:hypothetical protein
VLPLHPVSCCLLFWLYDAGDENGQRVLCPAEFMNHGRTILDFYSIQSRVPSCGLVQCIIKNEQLFIVQS